MFGVGPVELLIVLVVFGLILAIPVVFIFVAFRLLREMRMIRETLVSQKHAS